MAIKGKDRNEGKSSDCFVALEVSKHSAILMVTTSKCVHRVRNHIQNVEIL